MGLESARKHDLSEEGLRCPIQILARDAWAFNEDARERL
jgi:hypothetical protein